MNLSHVGTLQNEVKSCNLRAEIFMYVGNQTMLHSMQDGFEIIVTETSTAVKEDSLLMQLLKVKGEFNCIMNPWALSNQRM